jgi:hypothetical protein
MFTEHGHEVAVGPAKVRVTFLEVPDSAPYLTAAAVAEVIDDNDRGRSLVRKAQARWMRWSVEIRTEGDRIVHRDEIVELADAISTYSGIASGIDTMGYGAQIVVAGRTWEEAIVQGVEIFDKAVATAGLPIFPITYTDANSEEEDEWRR